MTIIMDGPPSGIRASQVATVVNDSPIIAQIQQDVEALANPNTPSDEIFGLEQSLIALKSSVEPCTGNPLLAKTMAQLDTALSVYCANSNAVVIIDGKIVPLTTTVNGNTSVTLSQYLSDKTNDPNAQYYYTFRYGERVLSRTVTNGELGSNLNFVPNATALAAMQALVSQF